MKAEARLHALADTVEEVEAKTLYETLSNIKSETVVYVLHDMPGKAEGQTNYCHTQRRD